MVIYMYPSHFQPQVGEVYVVEKRTYRPTSDITYGLYVCDDVKKYHGVTDSMPYYCELYGVRKILAIGPRKGSRMLKITLSEDLMPDHP